VVKRGSEVTRLDVEAELRSWQQQGGKNRRSAGRLTYAKEIRTVEKVVLLERKTCRSAVSRPRARFEGGTTKKQA